MSADNFTPATRTSLHKVVVIGAGFPSKLVTITRHVGIAEYGDRSITGFLAWLMWGLLHLRTLSHSHSKLSILANWLRLLITYRRSARLIIEPSPTAAVSDAPARLLETARQAHAAPSRETAC